MNGLIMFTHTEKDTLTFAKEFSFTLKPGDIVALHGDLGAGKTTFSKGVISSFSSVLETEVQSPTFTYLNIYEGNLVIYHFDLYRLKNEQEFIAMGFLDYLGEVDGICLIEWPNRITGLLPKGTQHIHFEHLEQGGREIHVH